MAIVAIPKKKALLKLVHPGGIVETSDRPITAAEVMERYPRHCVTRPDVFRNPWIVVRPESVLHPGDVFYVVPKHTIRKLIREKQNLAQSVHQEQVNGSRPGEGTNARSSSRAGTKHGERSKIDFSGRLAVRDGPDLCLYKESSFETDHSHQFVGRRSMNHDKCFEDPKLEEHAQRDHQTTDQFGVASSRGGFLGKEASGGAISITGSNDYADRKGFSDTDRRYDARKMHVQSAGRPGHRYKSSAEVAHIHRLLREISLNGENSKECESDREETFLKDPEKPRLHRQTLEEFIDQRSSRDFTFQPLNKDHTDIAESSPDLAPFRSHPYRTSLSNERNNTKSHNSGCQKRGDSNIKYPLNKSDHFKDLVPKKHEKSRFICQGSYCYNDLRCSGNDGFQRPEIQCRETEPGSGNVSDLILVTTYGANHCNCETSVTLRSCMKKNRLRLPDPRVKFSLPGEGKKLRVEVFEFQRSSSP